MALSNTCLVVGAAFAFSASLALLILSGVLDKSYWTFATLIPLILLIVPALFCLPRTQSRFATGLGYFAVGALAVSIFAPLLVMKHVDAITTQATVLAFFAAAGFLVAGGLIVARSNNSSSMYS